MTNLRKFRLNFSRCTNCDVAPLIMKMSNNEEANKVKVTNKGAPISRL